MRPGQRRPRAWRSRQRDDRRKGSNETRSYKWNGCREELSKGGGEEQLLKNSINREATNSLFWKENA